MLDSDFQTLGATSILTKRVAARKEECEEKWEGYHIFEAAKDGDKDCILAIDEMSDVLGRGIANICYVINPEVVVLEKSLRMYLVASIADKTKLAFAKHQNDAGMLGAYYNYQNRQCE